MELDDEPTYHDVLLLLMPFIEITRRIVTKCDKGRWYYVFIVISQVHFTDTEPFPLYDAALFPLKLLGTSPSKNLKEESLLP